MYPGRCSQPLNDGMDLAKVDTQEKEFNGFVAKTSENVTVPISVSLKVCISVADINKLLVFR